MNTVRKNPVRHNSLKPHNYLHIIVRQKQQDRPHLLYYILLFGHVFIKGRSRRQEEQGREQKTNKKKTQELSWIIKELQGYKQM